MKIYPWRAYWPGNPICRGAQATCPSEQIGRATFFSSCVRIFGGG